ncbi:MAG TPA: hypothetical protein VJR89_17590, partial [Polyangiales bacterium]|nr:hypothetical protein [Polyangiales bacterium]
MQTLFGYSGSWARVALFGALALQACSSQPSSENNQAAGGAMQPPPAGASGQAAPPTAAAAGSGGALAGRAGMGAAMSG